MPALPSKGKSRDLSVATLIPVSAYGVVKRLGSPDEEQHALLATCEVPLASGATPPPLHSQCGAKRNRHYFPARCLEVTISGANELVGLEIG